MTKQYEWEGSESPADESGYAVFYVGEMKSDKLHLPHVTYAREINKMIRAGIRAGYELAKAEAELAVAAIKFQGLP